jgi:group I intron endonuclease
METNNNKRSFVPVIVYNNVDINKSQILLDNKSKTGVYMWTNIQSGKIYIGSAYDLSKRFSQYFSIKYLKGSNNYICNALIHHSYSAFSIAILEYIDISNLSKEGARELILSREQYFLDLLFSVELGLNTYNILQIAGSSLGYRHTDESLDKMSGDNHYFFGKSHTVETLAKMSEAKSSENNPMFGKTHSADTLTKMSLAKGGGTIYVYDIQDTLVYTFSSARKAALHFESSHITIGKYVRNGKLFQNKWKLSLSLITKKE